MIQRMSAAEGVLLAIFLATVPFVNPYVRGDGNGYYAYVRSIVIDHDLDFENEYRRGDPAFRQAIFEPDGSVHRELRLPTGRVDNHWAVGPALVWTPFFFAAHGLVVLANAGGLGVAADGYSTPYRWFCALATAGFAFVGLWLAFCAARDLVGAWPAAIGTVGIWFASSLPVYMYLLPFQAHALAAFAVSLFLWYWRRTVAARSPGQWLLWGVLAGFMTSVYYLNVVVVLVAVVEWARATCPLPARLRTAGSFAVGAAVGLIPHAVTRQIIYGAPWRTGYHDPFFPFSPRLAEVGFSPEHGLFLWTPVIGLAVLGLLVLLWRRPDVAPPLVLTFAAFYYAVAAYQNWHGQSAFGSRFFVSLTPVFVFGLATLVATLASVVPRPVIIGGLGVLVAWNLGFIFQWGTKLVPNRGPVDFSVVARNQVTAVPGSVLSLGARYFTAKTALIREIEQRDLEELKGYRLRR